MFTLDGRVAVVTGAQGKLGSHWVDVLLRAGAKVAALDRREVQASSENEGLVQLYPDKLRFYGADVTDGPELEAAAEAISSELGGASILVNNAGIDQPPTAKLETHLLEDFPVSQFRQVLDVNVVGAFQCCQVFGKRMLGAGPGSIVNIGSLYSSLSPDPRLYDHLPTDPPFLKPPAYGASKAALTSLTRYFAVHWARQGVRVNTLSPGGVLGNQDAEFRAKFVARVPLGRMATLDDLTGPFLFLVSDASAYVTGQELLVDGGFTVL